MIDEAENNNIFTLVELSNRLKGRQLKNTETYHFFTNVLHNYAEKEVRENFSTSSKGDQLIILAVNGYRNLEINLLKDIPLFEPIVHKYNRNCNREEENRFKYYYYRYRTDWYIDT